MFDILTNRNKTMPGRGLYSVWIRADQTENAPLLRVWIDPSMKTFESGANDEAPAAALALVFPEMSDEDAPGPCSTHVLPSFNTIFGLRRGLLLEVNRRPADQRKTAHHDCLLRPEISCRAICVPCRSAPGVRPGTPAGQTERANHSSPYGRSCLR
jgi:hypothetical protein